MSAPIDSVADFDHLTPDVVLHLVEAALGLRCSNICRPLNSYINRVYEILTDEGEALIAKFYRPRRWRREALLEEHDFLLELAEAELPVIAPVRNTNGATLFENDGAFFAIFPKKGGRICDEPTPEQWTQLGRLMGRLHLVGAGGRSKARPVMGPAESAREHLETILASSFLPRECRRGYEQAARSVLRLIKPLFDDCQRIRIHGDLHHQNLIYRPGESFFLIDFDDMAMGPPVQDLWMLLPGRLADSRREVDLFLEGYETFCSFPTSGLRLIEPLRALRYLHYTAWCVRQASDGGFARLAPDWGSVSYWRQQVHDLDVQAQEIEDSLGDAVF